MKRKRIFTYTHKDKDGVLWRFNGNKPVSIISDQLMADKEWPIPSLQKLPKGDIRRNIASNKTVTEYKKEKKRGVIKQRRDDRILQ